MGTKITPRRFVWVEGALVEVCSWNSRRGGPAAQLIPSSALGLLPPWFWGPLPRGHLQILHGIPHLALETQHKPGCRMLVQF